MTDRITVKDSNGNNINIHTIEDSTSTHFNQSIPITVSGGLLFDSVPGNVSIMNQTLAVSIAGGSIAIADNAPVSVRGGVLNAVSIGGGTANIGTVSISPTQANIPVSLSPPSYNIPVSLHPVTINAGTALIGAVSIRQIVSVVPDGTGANFPVSIAGTPTFNLGTITGNIGVSIAGQTGNFGVSVINPTFNLPVSVHPVTQSGTWNVGVNAGTNLIGAVSIRQIVSVVPDGTGANFPVSIAPLTFNLPVSIAGGSISVTGGTQTVSIGARS
jgi:hypothetical protein